MPVFENLKNFIRHGKQAYGTTPNGSGMAPLTKPQSHQTFASDIIDSRKSSVTTTTAPIAIGPDYTTPSSNSHGEEPKSKTYDHAVKQIVASENEQRSHLPTYPGLERYSLLQKMGDGAFSIVYRAVDVHTQEQVAVKVIRKQDLNPTQHDRHLGAMARNQEKTDQRAAILKEVTIMRQLNHQNITKLIDFRETPDYYFIVLELIPGGELFHQIVRLTYFSEDLSRHVILQVAEAVRYLHEVAGVVHRDIKPENLLFYPCEFVPSKVKTIRKGEDANKVDEGEFTPGVGSGGIGIIKLADFGLSKIIWDSKTMTPCGTVGYTAPEIVKDERYSKSVDMWALGCVLYTILCGFPPFYDESIEVLTAKVAKGQFSFLSPWWDEISVEAKDLVSHLLEVDPEKRYTIDEFLAHPWIQKGVHGHPVQMNIDSFSQVLPTPGPPTAQVMTPAAATLKEVFDVSNAVYRMENDNRRANPFTTNNNVTIVEEEEVEGPHDGGLYIGGKRATAMDQVQQGMEKVSMRAPKSAVESGNMVGSSRRSRQQATAAQHGGFFELNLDGATLLGRRRQQNTQGTGPAIQSFS